MNREGNLFQFIPRNFHGRDFCVGDIHGAYDMVIQAMLEVGFDQRVDRLFGTGDLIDRDDDSYRARKFLERNFTFSVRGNHDDTFVGLPIADIRVLGSVDFNGLSWVSKVSDADLLEIQQLLRQLPIAMQIETARGMVGIVHGDIPKGMSWQAFVAAIENKDEDVISVALEGRDRFKRSDASGVKGIDRVFVGHSIQFDGPKRLGNVYCIDTGAVVSRMNPDKGKGTLTIANAICSTGVLAPRDSKAFVRLEAAEGVDGPFGVYAC